MLAGPKHWEKGNIFWTADEGAADWLSDRLDVGSRLMFFSQSLLSFYSFERPPVPVQFVNGDIAHVKVVPIVFAFVLCRRGRASILVASILVARCLMCIVQSMWGVYRISHVFVKCIRYLGILDRKWFNYSTGGFAAPSRERPGEKTLVQS